MLDALFSFRHRRLRRDLSAYLDGELGERARRRLEAHLSSCEGCRQELAELRFAVEALGSLPMAEVPRSFALATAPVAEVRPWPTARRLEFGVRLATAAAAFALAAVVIGDFAGLPGGGEEEEEMPAMLAPAAEEEQEAMEEAPAVTPAAPVPGITEAERAVPAETPAPPAFGITESAPTPAAVPGLTITEDEEAADKAAVPEAGEAQAEAAAEEGGPSRQEVMRWLEIGLSAGIGVLVLLWAFARLGRSVGNQP